MLKTKIKENLKNKYSDKNTHIFQHGKSYLQTAEDACKFIEIHPNNCYPILTLLALSIELFFKSLDVEDSSEKVIHNELTHYAQPQTQTNNKNGHNLHKLFSYISSRDHELYQYLSEQYFINHNYDLSVILTQNKNLFQETRYAFENSESKKYLQNVNTILELTKFLYHSIEELFG